ncbi:hypothetical protein GE21DRAFT_1275928 [Neurospora crassa]|nr:hypothetical protein GE21DRAFT_1275928 [Neurospora crassa]
MDATHDSLAESLHNLRDELYNVIRNHQVGKSSSLLPISGERISAEGRNKKEATYYRNSPNPRQRLRPIRVSGQTSRIRPCFDSLNNWNKTAEPVARGKTQKEGTRRKPPTTETPQILESDCDPSAFDITVEGDQNHCSRANMACTVAFAFSSLRTNLDELVREHKDPTLNKRGVNGRPTRRLQILPHKGRNATEKERKMEGQQEGNRNSWTKISPVGNFQPGT